MNLAVLQADFGCYEEAIAAMIETVSTARENRDMTCLNFSLNWLFHFGRAHPELVRDLESDSLLSTGKESIAYMRYRAKETGMWALWSSATLSEAKLCLAQGDSIAGTSALLVRSSQMLVEKNVQSMFGSQLSLVFSIWERLGVIQVSQTTCEVFLRCHAPLSVFDDTLKFTCRLASIMAAQGNYEKAQQTLDKMDENCLRSSQSAQYLSKQRGILKLWRDINRNNLDGAQQLLDQLHQSKLDDLDPDMMFVVDSLQLECFTRRGDLQAAFEKMISMDHRMRDGRQDVYYTVKLLLWKAVLLEKSGRLQRGFSIAMRAANLSWRARLMPCLWQAIGIVSNVLISLSEFRFTAQLLTSMIPRALETDSSQLVGRLYSTLADAHMGLAGQTEPKSSKRTEYMTAALRAVEKSFDQFSKLEDINKQCELVAKKAMIMKLAGDFKLAASYAAAYVELKQGTASE
jgi:anaphase-promoting complex subunit 5